MSEGTQKERKRPRRLTQMWNSKIGRKLATKGLMQPKGDMNNTIESECLCGNEGAVRIFFTQNVVYSVEIIAPWSIKVFKNKGFL